MAKLPSNLKLTEDEISQTIDLKKWTGKDLSSDPVLIREIGQEVLDYMIKRVDDNKGLGNEPLRPAKYSKTYSESLDFKAAGKSKGDVNMKLSGDMLGTIDFEDSGNNIKFAIDPAETLKAYGHMTGYKGHPTIPQGKYKRQFFGITKDEFDKNILPKFKADLPKDRGEDLQGQLISRIKNASDLFNTEETLAIGIYRDLKKLISEEG